MYDLSTTVVRALPPSIDLAAGYHLLEALRNAVRGICVKVVRPRAVMSLACGGRAAAHYTRAETRGVYILSTQAVRRSRCAGKSTRSAHETELEDRVGEDSAVGLCASRARSGLMTTGTA